VRDLTHNLGGMFLFSFIVPAMASLGLLRGMRNDRADFVPPCGGLVRGSEGAGW